METTRETGITNTIRSERLRVPAGAGRQWWKAWILLTSLAATVLGWIAFTGDEAAQQPVAASNVQVSAPVAPVLTVGRLDALQRLERNVGTLPPMPQKPVFQAPVTRTRRS